MAVEWIWERAVDTTDHCFWHDLHHSCILWTTKTRPFVVNNENLSTPTLRICSCKSWVPVSRKGYSFLLNGDPPVRHRHSPFLRAQLWVQYSKKWRNRQIFCIPTRKLKSNGYIKLGYPATVSEVLSKFCDYFAFDSYASFTLALVVFPIFCKPSILLSNFRTKSRFLKTWAISQQFSNCISQHTSKCIVGEFYIPFSLFLVPIPFSKFKLHQPNIKRGSPAWIFSTRAALLHH